MRTIAFVAAALLLAGCETGDGWVPADDRALEKAPPAMTSAPAPTAPLARVAKAPVAAAPAPPAPVPPAPLPLTPVPPAPVAPAPVPPPAPVYATTSAPAPTVAPYSTIDVHCQAVAHQRASDARANGYSFEMESTVYDGTYQACVAWDTRRAPGSAP